MVFEIEVFFLGCSSRLVNSGDFDFGFFVISDFVLEIIGKGIYIIMRIVINSDIKLVYVIYLIFWNFCMLVSVIVVIVVRNVYYIVYVVCFERVLIVIEIFRIFEFEMRINL